MVATVSVDDDRARLLRITRTPVSRGLRPARDCLLTNFFRALLLTLHGLTHITRTHATTHPNTYTV